MGEPIISPWIFYVGDVLTAMSFMVVICAVVCVVCFVKIQDKVEDLYKYRNCYCDKQEQEDNLNIQIKLRKKICIIFGICVLLFTFVPSKTTYYNMVVAHYVTYENLDKAKELTKDSLDYVLDKIIETAKKAG